MADLSGQALTVANTSIKTSFELEKMLLELLRTMINLIPEPTIANTMRKEMELGHIEVEMFNSDDQQAVKDELSKKGLKEGKDYMFATYHRVNGEKFTALFYNISDADIIKGMQSKIDPSSTVNRENIAFFEGLRKCGINPDRTLDLEKFEKFCQSKGVNVPLSQPISNEDKELVKELFSSEFSNLSDEQINAVAQKMSTTGVMDVIFASKAAGNVPASTLYNLSCPEGSTKASIKNLQNIPVEHAMAIEKRAEANGLRISIAGPDENNQCMVSFASRDEALMKRVYAESKFDLHGEAGEIYKKHLAFENEYMKQTLNSALSQEFPDGTKVPEGSMLVGLKVEPMLDRNGKAIINPETGMAVVGRQTLEFDRNRMYMNGEAKNINKDASTQLTYEQKNFASNVINCFGDSKTVFLNPQQAQQYLAASTEKEKLSILQKAQENAEHGFVQKPGLSKDDIEIVKEHEKYRQLVEKKLQDVQPVDSKMAAYIYSISPYEMYMNDQLINGGYNQNEREYFRGGNNFANRAELESSDFADALSLDERAEMEDIFRKLDDEMMVFNQLEDGTKEFEAGLQFDSIVNGQQPIEDIFEHEMEQESALDSIEDREGSGHNIW